MLPYLRLHLLYPRSGGVSLSPRDITAPGQPPPRSPRPENAKVEAEKNTLTILRDHSFSHETENDLIPVPRRKNNLVGEADSLQTL